MAASGMPMKTHRRPGRLQKTQAEKLHGFNVHLIVYLCVNIGLMALNFRKNPDHLWFYWVAVGWGIGIAFHAWRVFYFTDDDTNLPGLQNTPTGTED